MTAEQLGRVGLKIASKSDVRRGGTGEPSASYLSAGNERRWRETMLKGELKYETDRYHKKVRAERLSAFSDV